MEKTTILEPDKFLVGEIVVDYVRKVKPTTKITSSEMAYQQFKKLFNRINYRESFYMIPMDRLAFMLGWVRISEGGISGTVVDSKIIFQHALMAHASSFIIAHNHPSGNINPSNADKKLTQVIKKAGEYLGLPLNDHLILSDHSYFSFSDEGLI